MGFHGCIGSPQEYLRIVGLTLQQRLVEFESLGAVTAGGVHPGEGRHRLNVVRTLGQGRGQRVVCAGQITAFTQQIGLTNAVAIQQVVETFTGLHAHGLPLHSAQDRIDLHVLPRREQQTGVLQQQIR